MNWNWAMRTAISTVSTDVESAYMAVRSHKNQFIHKLSASSPLLSRHAAQIEKGSTT